MIINIENRRIHSQAIDTTKIEEGFLNEFDI